MANYQTVKDGIAALVKSLGYSESSQAVDFTHAPANEYANTYILKCISGEMGSETINDRFYDHQKWSVKIAYERSENNDITNLDNIHLAKDALLKKLDNPASWVSFVRLMKYDKWEVVETPNYFVLDITLSVIDTYTY